MLEAVPVRDNVASRDDPERLLVSRLKQQVKWLMQQQQAQDAPPPPPPPPPLLRRQQLPQLPQQHPAAAAVSVGPQQWLSVTTFGAHADGSTDDTASFQAALDAAQKAGNAVVTVPAGTYSIKGHLRVPSNCELRGDNHFPYRSWGSGSSIPKGTTVIIFL